MIRKSPHELEAGSVLAEQVLNLDGKVLYAKGHQLEAPHIEILMMWGVDSVLVEGDGDSDLPVDLDQFSRQIRSKAEASINARFRLVKSSHPAVETIKKIAVLETAKAVRADLS